MKWVITGVLAVSAVAVFANGNMGPSNDDSEASAAAIQSNEGGDTPTAEAIAKERAFMTFSNDGGGSANSMDQAKEVGEASPAEAIAKERAFMTFSNDGNKPDGGFYTTPGGCTAPRRPEIEHYDIAGAASLRFLESSYIHQVAASIEAAGGECTCELRFPSWDDAVDDLNNRFAKLPDDESSAWVRQFADQDRSRLTREVNKHCKAQGIY